MNQHRTHWRKFLRCALIELAAALERLGRYTLAVVSADAKTRPITLSKDNP